MEVVDGSQRSQKLEVHGNATTMNLPEILLVNIQSCTYFKDLFQLKTYHEVLAEIQRKVKYLDPYVPNAGTTPSTAFCLLYKLFTLKLTVKQMNGMLNSKDSQFVRAIGFMYLRFSLPPKDLYGWCEYYLADDSTFRASARGSEITMGKFVRDMLTQPKWCDIYYPRIPIPIQRQINDNLKEFDKEMGAEAQQAPEDDPPRGGRSPARVGRSRSPPRRRSRSRSRSPRRDRDRDRDRKDDRRDTDRDRDRDRRDRDRRDRRDKDRRRSRSRSRSRSPPRRRSRSPPKHSRSRSPRKSPKRSRSRSPRRSRSPAPPATIALAKSVSPPLLPSAAAQLDKVKAMYAADTKIVEKPVVGIGKFDSSGAETLVLGAPAKKKPPPT